MQNQNKDILFFPLIIYFKTVPRGLFIMIFSQKNV